jgi:protein SCO1/2
MKPAICAIVLCFTVCAGVLVLFVALTASTSSRPATESTSDLSDLAFRPHPGALLPLSTQLFDEHGRSVALSKYFNKSPVILVLDYLRCKSLCGVTLHNLVDALDRLPLVAGRDYQLVTISIDPRDKPTDAARARANYVGPLDRDDGASGIHFLTAAPTAVQEIADAVGFSYRYDSLLDAYIHPAGFIVATPNGAISHYVEGAATSPRELVDVLADAQQDKSQGPLTRVLLLCHVQGAPLGRLTVPVLAAFTAADISAGFALIALFTLIRRRRLA